MIRPLRKALQTLFLTMGVLFLIALIRRIGLNTVIANIVTLGWRLIPIMSISFLWGFLYTIGWQQFLQRMSNKISFWELFRIKIAGEAVNTLTPVNFIGGDPLRIYLLKKRLPVAEGAASVVVDRTLHSVATVLVVVIGVAVSFLMMERFTSNIKFGVPLVLIVATGFIAFVFFNQRRGIFGSLLSTCKKLGIKREFSETTIARFEKLDSHIIDFYRSHHRGFLIALSCHIAGRLLGIIEVYAIGKSASADFTMLTALVLSSLAPMINTLFTFIPGALGILEGVYSGALYLLGYNPAIGITIQIAKRIRGALWIALGLFFLGAHERKKAWEEKLIEEV